MSSRRPATGGSGSISERDEKRLRRLAILLAAQLPDNPEQAMAALDFTRDLVQSCGAAVVRQCPRQGACPDFHAMLAMADSQPALPANEP
jgi:hypothetical protein